MKKILSVIAFVLCTFDVYAVDRLPVLTTCYTTEDFVQECTAGVYCCPTGETTPLYSCPDGYRTVGSTCVCNTPTETGNDGTGDYKVTFPSQAATGRRGTCCEKTTSPSGSGIDCYQCINK